MVSIINENIVNEGDGCASFGCVNTGWVVKTGKNEYEYIRFTKVFTRLLS